MEPTHIRKGKTIRNLADDSVKVHESINAAKRASREIQKSNGGLGMGAVKVER